jgi:hypothetical protein
MILVVTWLAGPPRTAPMHDQIASSNTGTMSGHPTAAVGPICANAPVVRAPRRKPMEFSSIATCFIAKARPLGLLAAAPLMTRAGAEVSQARLSRLQI